jgi:hypothetical protein
MPRIKLTKSAIDALPPLSSDVVYWDAAYPGFGVKVTPKGRKVFIVLYRTGGAGSHLRKYTIGTYGRVTLHQARVAAQKVFAAKADGRDPAAEKREPSAELWQIGSMICLRTSLPSGFQRTARSPRSPGFFVGRWESHGRVGASTSSPSEMWLKLSQQLSNAARAALPTKP